MTFLQENFEYIVYGLFLLTFLLLFVLIAYNRFFSKHFSNKKFQIKSGYEIEPLTRESRFSIEIFNNNINDTRITGFGFTYKNQNIDYYKTYLAEKNLPNDAKVIIPSRDFLRSQVNVDDFKIIISDINRGKYRVGKIAVYVTDSLGLTSKANSKSVRSQLKSRFCETRKTEKVKLAEIHQKERDEKQNDRIKIRSARRIRLAERWNKFVFIIKTKLKK